MNAKNPKFAIAPKGTYNSFEGGTKFEIIKLEIIEEIVFFEIISPLDGDILYCLAKGCAHLDGKNWILRNK